MLIFIITLTNICQVWNVDRVPRDGLSYRTKDQQVKTFNRDPVDDPDQSSTFFYSGDIHVRERGKELNLI